MWIYRRKQCHYCLNSDNCEYKSRMNEYIAALDAIDSHGIYGRLKFNCSYFYIDKEKYLKENPDECNAVQ